MKAIAQEGCGVLIYEQQEGRGIGLMAKLQAYALQDRALTRLRQTTRSVLKQTAGISACPAQSSIDLGIRQDSPAFKQS